MLCVAAATAVLTGAEKRPLNNADVIKMVKAELPESTILIAVQGSARAFDTSADALIELKAAGVPKPVIEAMLGAAKPAVAPAPTAAPTAAAPAPVVVSIWGSKLTRIETDRIFLVDGAKRTEMKYTRPTTRTRAMIPFGGMQQFAVLGGTKAGLRIGNRAPAFEMIVPNNVQPSSVTALGLLGERPNGTREILIGGGYMSFSAGLPKDRNVALNFEKAADQSAAPEGYEVYRITAAASLKNGEYAFMVAKANGEVGGVFGAGAGASYNFYEFAVE